MGDADANGIWKPPEGYRPKTAPENVRATFFANLALAIEAQSVRYPTVERPDRYPR